MKFDPEVGDSILVNGNEYEFVKLEAAQAFVTVHAASGRKGTVYRLIARQDHDSEYALKVFYPEYRTPHVVRSSEQLARYKDIHGLAVCDRTVICSTTDCPHAGQYPDLLYSILMPWISGRTWFDVVLSEYSDSQDLIVLSLRECVELARLTSQVLTDIEQQGLAHCDIASGNIIFDLERRTVELVDVEDMYGPRFTSPEGLTAGSKGYTHKSVRDGVWCAEADRFAGAVLLAEVLCWHDQRVRELVKDETYFTDNEEGQDCPRYRAVRRSLEETYTPRLAMLFEQAWFSDRLEQCPRMSTWANAIAELTIDEPVLEISPRGLNLDFGQVKRAAVSRTIEIQNAGTVLLTGSISALDAPWLTVDRTTFSLQPGERCPIRISARQTREITEQQIALGDIQVESDGGQATLMASAEFVAVPKRRRWGLGLAIGIVSFIACIALLNESFEILIPALLVIAILALVAHLRARKERSAKRDVSGAKDATLPATPAVKARKKKKPDVLIVTPQGTDRGAIEDHLRQESLQVTSEPLGSAASAIRDIVPRLVVVKLPRVTPDSVSAYRALRDRCDAFFILWVEENVSPQAFVDHELMAEEYLLGSTPVQELAHSAQALLGRRPYQPQSASPIRVGPLTLEPKTRRVRADRRLLDLQGLEFDLLVFLMEHEQVNRREQLYQAVWGGQSLHATTVDVHIERLRKRLGHSAVRIANVANKGYILVEV